MWTSFLPPPGGHKLDNFKMCKFSLRIVYIKGVLYNWWTSPKLRLNDNMVSWCSLAQAEGEVDVLLLGKEQDEEVITRLTLLDGRIQADLLRNRTQTEFVKP